MIQILISPNHVCLHSADRKKLAVVKHVKRFPWALSADALIVLLARFMLRQLGCGKMGHRTPDH
jgi:hypothetical protein